MQYSEEDLYEMGYVIRCLDAFTGEVSFRGKHEKYSRVKDAIRPEDTYTLTAAKKVLTKLNNTNSEDKFYSIERLNSYYFPLEEYAGDDKSERVKVAIEAIDRAYTRLDELWDGNDFNRSDKMRINEVRNALKWLKEFIIKLK